MVNRVLKYLIQKLIGKNHNCIMLHPDCIIATKLLHLEYSSDLVVTKDIFGILQPDQTKTIEVTVDPNETVFIF